MAAKTLLLPVFRERRTCSWNSLPDKVAEAPSIQSFEGRLDKHWRDQNLVINYDYEQP